MPQHRYDVTIVETIIHTFTVEVFAGESPAAVAERVYKNGELDNHRVVNVSMEVENVTPQ